MTVATTEELRLLASSDNTNELTRRLARECLANREEQPVAYLNKFSGVCMTLEQQPNAAHDAAVYVPLYLAPPAPGAVKLPATRLWAGVTECYEKSDVIAAIRAAGGEVSDD
ncbi:hypothetical protein C3468_16135 [Serratia marcescens]|nr:hypothetical protein C3468_16135 [Serratia marcescens]